MQITGKVAQQMIGVLDDLREEIKNESKIQYPYAEWERQREKVKKRLEKLHEYIEQAAAFVKVSRTRGPEKELDLVKRTTLFLFARLMNKSNRDMEDILILLQLLFGSPVSYKTIERLYSDEEVKLVLHNLFQLLLKDENVSGDMTGDGTGYSVTVTRHYRSNPHKRGRDYRYVFRLMDLLTGMYVGVGYSPISEMRAFHKAIEMAKSFGVRIDTLRLDKYYSSKKVLKLFGEDVSVFVIPKKNISNIGLEWSRVIRNIMAAPFVYLKSYFKRNLSESGFSSDKRRFGGLIRQKREDRQSMAMLAIGLLHNLFFIRVQK